MPGSTIPAARTALIDALTANTDLAGVLVARSGVWKDRPQDERIEVLNARDIEREPRLRAHNFAERYTIPVRITATRGGDDLETIEDRMWELTTLVEQTALANHTLGGLVVHIIPGNIPNDTIESGPTESRGVVSTLVLELDVEARASLE